MMWNNCNDYYNSKDRFSPSSLSSNDNINYHSSSFNQNNYHLKSIGEVDCFTDNEDGNFSEGYYDHSNISSRTNISPPSSYYEGATPTPTPTKQDTFSFHHGFSHIDCCEQSPSFGSLQSIPSRSTSKEFASHNHDVFYPSAIIPQPQQPLSSMIHAPGLTAPVFAVASTNNGNNVFKCRQLPCRTFISTGSCPYGDRCVFLHPDGLVSKPVYIKTKVCLFFCSFFFSFIPF
jgi:hypothetical protein